MVHARNPTAPILDPPVREHLVTAGQKFLVEPSGHRQTNTIQRAELAGIYEEEEED
jgi:hypothetical protein